MPTKHPFVNPKPDGADATITRPSNWNADHTVEEQYGPNLVLNSDYGRRTVFGLAMSEAFADLLGTTKIDAGAAGSVAGNIFTQGAANNEYAWCAASFAWRDGRVSAPFKATAIAGIYELRFRIDATHYVSVKQNNGNFTIVENTGGGVNVLTTTANVLTINRWYWLEIEMQGSRLVARMLDTGGTVPGVAKASSTLIAATALAATTSFSNSGCHVSITSDQAAAQWGGVAAGSVNVETWLPESNSLSAVGTIGGQAWGIDESADAGPIGKQWALRMYVPAASRILQGLPAYTKTVQVVPSAAYVFSGYLKVSGLGGSGVLVRFLLDWLDSSGALISTVLLTDAGETAWTRKSTAVTSPATAKYAVVYVQANPGSTATGTGFASCLQLEQGAAATAWRPAEGGADIFSYETVLAATNLTIASAVLAELDPHDGAIEVFMPYDGTLTIDFLGAWGNSAAGNENRMALRVDGADTATRTGFNAREGMPSTAQQTFCASGRGQYAAGKHRVSVLWAASAGTATMYASSQDCRLRVTIQRGK